MPGADQATCTPFRCVLSQPHRRCPGPCPRRSAATQTRSQPSCPPSRDGAPVHIVCVCAYVCVCSCVFFFVCVFLFMCVCAVCERVLDECLISSLPFPALSPTYSQLHLSHISPFASLWPKAPPAKARCAALAVAAPLSVVDWLGFSFSHPSPPKPRPPPARACRAPPAAPAPSTEPRPSSPGSQWVASGCPHPLAWRWTRRCLSHPRPACVGGCSFEFGAHTQSKAAPKECVRPQVPHVLTREATQHNGGGAHLVVALGWPNATAHSLPGSTCLLLTWSASCPAHTCTPPYLAFYSNKRLPSHPLPASTHTSKLPTTPLSQALTDPFFIQESISDLRGRRH